MGVNVYESLKIVKNLKSKMTIKIEGEIDPGYEDVKTLFQNGFESGMEYNAQLCVYVKGE